MGGGANSTPPSDVPPGGGGIYPETSYNAAFKELGQGISGAGSAYAKTVQAGNQSQSQVNYQSGSGSPWLGGGQSASADMPANTAAPRIPIAQDQQKLIYQLFQQFQQRVQNERGGSGQFQF